MTKKKKTLTCGAPQTPPGYLDEEKPEKQLVYLCLAGVKKVTASPRLYLLLRFSPRGTDSDGVKRDGFDKSLHFLRTGYEQTCTLRACLPWRRSSKTPFVAFSASVLSLANNSAHSPAPRTHLVHLADAAAQAEQMRIIPSTSDFFCVSL